MIYVYRCRNCQIETEVSHRMTETPAIVCTKCGGIMRKRPQVIRVNWGGLRPSQGELAPEIAANIANAPRRQDEIQGELQT
ncbi:MAG: zinc ribbon domain-containing protein, partial [Gammaproteobacteria bacterium]|nr:zinc ribbon domain-containing protein [Gammaproteobacteria bacterium]MBU2395766.1 zinc ribbon domain-containing protein [Gammaproteobacteria bacterium]